MVGFWHSDGFHKKRLQLQSMKSSLQYSAEPRHGVNGGRVHARKSAWIKKTAFKFAAKCADV
jgi:hypothetical protein